METAALRALSPEASDDTGAVLRQKCSRCNLVDGTEELLCDWDCVRFGRLTFFAPRTLASTHGGAHAPTDDKGRDGTAFGFSGDGSRQSVVVRNQHNCREGLHML